MTIDESIEVLIRHKLHWENLLEQGICNAHEGRETISSLTVAIANLEAWEKVKAEIEELEIVYESYFADDTRTDAQKSADWWKMDKQTVLQIIDKHLQEVADD